MKHLLVDKTSDQYIVDIYGRWAMVRDSDIVPDQESHGRTWPSYYSQVYWPDTGEISKVRYSVKACRLPTAEEFYELTLLFDKPEEAPVDTLGIQQMIDSARRSLYRALAIGVTAGLVVVISVGAIIYMIVTWP